MLGLLLIAQLAGAAPGGPSRTQLLLRTGGELVLAGAVAANMLLIGAASAPTGRGWSRAMLPHGPVELAAYALALALYLQGRRRHSGRAADSHGRRSASRCWRSPPPWRRSREPDANAACRTADRGGVGASVLLTPREADAARPARRSAAAARRARPRRPARPPRTARTRTSPGRPAASIEPSRVRDDRVGTRSRAGGDDRDHRRFAARRRRAAAAGRR